ncbi:hypothetical protein CLV46_0017 [Diaminobutyricimonas aerilata]|uniref:Uncharacterized protein n=1 Tax=Diaminobutyricimonas aerilata TaxID=1162967 RepID=A0A2M9CEW9_9MICO|nr:hypothetical protein [Diaminobutyricimonas aerilata]PJJ70496.1 hypothetical protein CLV46_0017 [Diaminobutyricimonas aerilata]
MNSNLRRVVLALTVLIGAYVGIWGYVVPDAFYTSFPGFGLHWIDIDGPFNEHLIRDVGSLYIALGAGSLVAIFTRTAMPGRVMGVVWFVFGVLHFGYHVLHPEGTTLDVVGSIVSLGVSALVGVVLMLPLEPHADRAGTSPSSAPGRA